MASSAASALKVLSTNGLDSTEGTVSRFLPNLMTYRALKQLKMDNPTLKAELDNAINFAVQKLESEQHKDGGWGWFVADNSNGLITAYVLIGLSEARKEGVAVDPGTFSRAIVFVQRALAGNIRPDNTNSQLNQQAFLVYALGRAGAPDLTQVLRLWTGREKLNWYVLAYIPLVRLITVPLTN